jgi:hypothetical protein
VEVLVSGHFLPESSISMSCAMAELIETLTRLDTPSVITASSANKDAKYTMRSVNFFKALFLLPIRLFAEASDDDA